MLGQALWPSDLVMSVDPLDVVNFLPHLEKAARSAGDIALGFFNPGERTSAVVSYKHGGSPVTEADLLVDRFLFQEMRRLTPEAAWLSEESTDSDARLANHQLIIVDPIDGTTAFARGDPRWAISIAYIVAGQPLAGVIHAPALDETFTAVAGQGAFLNGRQLVVTRRNTLAGAAIVAPRLMHSALQRTAYNFVLAPRAPSLALRLADVAAGRHDLVIAAPNSRDWDIAAADIILREAGSFLSELDEAPLVYNRSRVTRGTLIAAPAPLFNETRALVIAASKGDPTYDADVGK